MESDAMNYEYLIRRAFQCGRFGVAGANADIFRRYERLHSEYLQDKMDLNNLSKYMMCVGEVSAYIKMATSIVRKNHTASISDAQKTELENVETLLFSTDKNRIVEAITRAEKVMIDLGLFPC